MATEALAKLDLGLGSPTADSKLLAVILQSVYINPPDLTRLIRQMKLIISKDGYRDSESSPSA
jgi:hypothetical protein